MTREEAIECLSERVSIGKTCEQSCMVGFGVNIDTLDKALDMAISALRQQETVTDSHQTTNADRIRAMSDEELAEMLWKTGRNYRAVCADPVVDHDEQYAELVKWLQQPVEIEEA